jgi:heavy metal efflux system protein
MIDASGQQVNAMIRGLIGWALDNPLIVLLLAAALCGFGVYSFTHVNVEAYPDPAPAIVEVVAPYNGASAEEIERQVTVPLEVTLDGMPGLKYIRSKSLFGLSHLRIQFEYGVDYNAARQEVINRLQFTKQLPPGVSPSLSPESPTGEIFRYTLDSPKDVLGRDIYTLNDLKALQDWVLEREFRRVPRIVDVSSSGGTVKRYEIHADPDRLRRYGVTLAQLQAALTNSNASVGGDNVSQGAINQTVRSVALFGGGEDPVRKVIGMKDPDPSAAEELIRAEKEKLTNIPVLREAQRRRLAELREAQRRRLAMAASAVLRNEEHRRLREIRQLVIASFNNQPVLVEDVVEGGRLLPGQTMSDRGVVVGNQTRLGLVGVANPLHRTGKEQRNSLPDGTPLENKIIDDQGQVVALDEPEKVQCIVLLRKNEDSLPALRDVKAKVDELNDPQSGRMLPGVKIDTYYDRTELIGITTETVRENLFMGMVLVTVILLMFISNVRAALIVAINIPLALLFAFAVLFLRGKSANLLSIGAVDFGIIVDSAVIMVENIYRHLSSGEHADLPLKERILRASGEINRALLFSRLIMICAFIPLFTMRGPEGQMFGPMADTYVFALAGALLLSVTLAPVLCLFFLKHLKPTEDNFLFRFLKYRYLRQLTICLKYRWTTLIVMSLLVVFTAALLVMKKADGNPYVGREFMPELEEGNLWIRGTSPLNANLERVAEVSREARAIMISYPEAETVVNQVGRPDDGTDPSGFYNSEYFVPLKPHKSWAKVVEQHGWRRWLYGAYRARTKVELIDEMTAELKTKLPGIDWNFSQNIRDNVMESLSGVKGDNSVKIFGPDLGTLQELAAQVKNVMEKVKGIVNVGVFDIQGQSNLEFRVDAEKCKKWGVQVADVNNVIASALGGKALTTMIEGEKMFDVSVRWPKRLRGNETSILDIPVDITNNQVSLVSGPSPTPSSSGNSQAAPSGKSSQTDTTNPLSNTPRLRLRDLLSPVGADGVPNPKGSFQRAAASTIYREQGNRLIAIKFSVQDRDLGSAVNEARRMLTQTLYKFGDKALALLREADVPEAVLAKLSPLKDQVFDHTQFQAELDKILNKEERERFQSVLLEKTTTHVLEAPYRAVWSGEFEEMEEAEGRLLIIIPVALSLIIVLLYMAFRSIIDSIVVFSNVLALAIGGIWALWLTGTNFSIAAAVGFVSLFGVAIMDGLLLISSFNALRAHGLPVREAILQGAAKRVRPVTMTALTAILGLLPAALSTRIGAQTQRPLAIVVVGGMIMTLALTRYLMPVLYSFYGHREPPAGSGDMAH